MPNNLTPLENLYGSPPSTSPAPDAPSANPDPGTPTRAKIAWIALILLTLGVFGVNQFDLFAGGHEPPPAAATNIEPPQFDQFVGVSKAIVKLAKVLDAPGGQAGQLMTNIDQAARTPVEKFRAAAIAWDLAGNDAAESRLKNVLGPGPDEHDAPPPAELAGDVDLLTRAVREGVDSLSAPERDGLVARHGWFGRLIVTHGLPNTAPERQALVSGGMLLLTVVGGFALVVILALCTGLVLLIVLLVKLSNGGLKTNFDRPAPGGSVFVETVAVFVFIFLVVLKLGLSLVAARLKDPPDWLPFLGMGLQWSMVLVPLYPLCRGVPFADLRRRMGWHSGKGVLREMGAGFVAYLASLPVLALAFVFTIIIVVIWTAISTAIQGHPSEPPSNHIADLLGSGSKAELILLFTLATIWAPLVEESLFRGALYRDLRARMGVFGAAAISALFFGVMHGYAVMLLLPVITLGLIFSLMREWRGSLVGSMFAHGLHNATVLTLALTVLSILRD